MVAHLELRVLTYNVHWGVMSGNKQKGNAFSKMCFDKSGECKRNVMENIRRHKPDILGTQESASLRHWDDVPFRRQYMAIVTRFADDGPYKEIITFVRRSAFVLIGYAAGRAFDAGSRPIQFLHFRHAETGHEFVFVNLHNGHDGCSQFFKDWRRFHKNQRIWTLEGADGAEESDLIATHSEFTSASKLADDVAFDRVHQYSKARVAVPLQATRGPSPARFCEEAERDYVVVGDFNDPESEIARSAPKLWGEARLRLHKADTEAVRSCCVDKCIEWDPNDANTKCRFTHPGDYVLIGGASCAIVEGPYDASIDGVGHASDHLPVGATVRIETGIGMTGAAAAATGSDGDGTIPKGVKTKAVDQYSRTEQKDIDSKINTQVMVSGAISGVLFALLFSPIY